VVGFVEQGLGERFYLLPVFIDESLSLRAWVSVRPASPCKALRLRRGRGVPLGYGLGSALGHLGEVL